MLLPGICCFKVTKVGEHSFHYIIADNLNYIDVTESVSQLLGNFPEVFR